MSEHQTVLHDAGTSKILVFDEVYSFRASQEQAEKKKLGAFGMMAKFNPLNRPKEDTVQPARQELRYEPFWHIQAKRSVDYTSQLTYQVPVHNPHARSVEIEGRSFEVARLKDKPRIEVVALERCHRKMQFDRLIDGLARDIKPAALDVYVRKYKFTEVERLDRPELVKPLVSMVAAKEQAKAELNREAVNATEIQDDSIDFERTYMYVRPVFAFEFRWSSADRVGVIEVDGLTGEVIENGHWFTDKVNRIVTRDMLVELGAEVAGSFIPGGGTAVKLMIKMADPEA
jgi:hypothetical protein